ncbi:MAG: S1 RNA-binding domain-containing protein [Patescibacteria group bacterium]|nr:S1 RNA-binding domain-containing protein [Patescibacteria group bacterium]
MTKKEPTKMKDLLTAEEKLPHLAQAGELVEGRIIKLSKNTIIVELGPLGTGIIYGGEWKENKSIIKDLKVGDIISALVLASENDDGYVELSIKEAHMEKIWTDLRKKKQSGEITTAKIIEANRGGLVIECSGMIGFLPVSQLSSENYPRVDGGDKNIILKELSKFIGQEMKVKIISLDKKTEKLIVSEKATQEKKLQENLENYKKGDIVDGTVAALTNFGAFIKINDNLEGLAHISELDWQIIDHPSQVLKENEKIKVQIIDIQNGQISFSLKSLKKDPWHNAKNKYQNGQTIQGKVIKFTPNGAFVQVDDGIHGLTHTTKESNLELNQSYNFEILSLSPETHKMALALSK